MVALSLSVILLYGGMIWYVFPDVDVKVSWEGHLAGLLTGFALSLFYKAPEYSKPIVYEWQKPDFNPLEDPFMKHFDENGNFVNIEKDEDGMDEIQSYFHSDTDVYYIVTKTESADNQESDN